MKAPSLLLLSLLLTGYATAQDSNPTDPQSENEHFVKFRTQVDTVSPYFKVSKGSTSKNPWSHLDFYNQAENFQFAIVTDRTGGERPGIFSVGLEKLNLMKPEFVMSVGDLIEGYTDDVDQLNREWDEFTGFIDQLEAPFFYVPGNHDITNEVMEEIWEERFGRTYYHFIYNDVLFLALNSEEAIQGSGGGGIEDEQYEYIKNVLDMHPDVRWTMVFTHQPMWVYEDPRRWWDVEALLADRNHTVFAGHYHNYVKRERNNANYYTLATTGGGSRMRGPLFGEFDHIVWVTMTDNGPVVANLLLDGILDDDIRTEELADMVNMVSSEVAMTIQPIFDHTVTQQKYTAKIQNYSNSPMKADLQVMDGTGAETVQTIPLDLDPNSVVMQDFSVNHTDPIQVKASYKYAFDGYPDLETDQTVTLKPQFFHTLAETDRRVKVDGDLSEWAQLRYSSAFALDMETESPVESDNGFRFDVSMKGRKLVVAVEVTDDEFYVPGGNPLNQDGIGVIIDANPLDKSSQNNLDQEKVFEDWFPLLITPSDDEVNELAYQSIIGKYMSGALKRTPTGYTAEFEMPLKAIMRRMTEGDGTFRLNVLMNDFDRNGESHVTLGWKPSWDQPTSALGSGTFAFDPEDAIEDNTIEE
jgi:hypothetical protein